MPADTDRSTGDVGNMAKILFVSNTDGAQFKFRGSLMRRLVDRGHAVTSIASYDSPEGCYLDKLKDRCTSTISTEFLRRGPTGYLKTIGFVWRHLGCNTYDIVHCFGHEAAVPIMLARRQLGDARLFVTLTGLGRAYANDASFPAAIARAALNRLYRHSRRRVDKFIFLNADDLDELSIAAELPKNRCIQVMGEGFVDPVGIGDKGSVRNSSVEHGEIKILFAGRLMRDKGILDLIEAAGRTTNSRLHFVVAGSIDEDLREASEIRELLDGDVPNASYVGYVSNIRSLIEECHAVILPTRYREGLPRSLIEGLAFDKYIITTDAPGARETVRDGRNGVVLRSGDVAQLVAFLDRLEPRIIEESRGRSRELFLKEFEQEIINARMFQLYFPDVVSR